MRSRIDAASSKAKTSGEPKRVLFILSMQGGRVMAAGSNTSADGIIALAGGVNAVTDFEGFKPLTDEAIARSGADVILMMDRSGDHEAANEQLLSHAALKALPAARNNAVVRMDGMKLLGFSVRTGEAVAAHTRTTLSILYVARDSLRM